MNTKSPQATDGSTMTDAGLRRRTLVAGAAWAAPAIVLATTAPYASASGVVTLAFNPTTYSATGCQTITGVTVNASQNGAPSAGTSVVVTLPSGYTYSGGGTSYSGVSNASGVVSVPGIVTPAAGGTVSFVAASGSASTSASAAVTPYTTAKRWTAGSTTPVDWTTVPAGSKAIGGGDYFLAPNGDLYWQATKVIGNVTSAQGWMIGGDQYATVVTGGVAKRIAGGTVAATWTGPAKTALWADYYLDSNGTLYWQNTKVMSNVISASGWNVTQDQYVSVTAAPPLAGRAAAGAMSVMWPGLPQVTPVGGDYNLTTNGDLYCQTTKVASNVTSAQGWNIGSDQYATFVTGGVAKRAGGGNVAATWTGPATTALAGDYYLDSNGNLYSQNTKVTSNVTNAKGWLIGGNQYATIITGGVAKRVTGAGVTDTWTGPATTALAGDHYLDSSGNFYLQNTKVASNVTSAVGWNIGGDQYATIVTGGVAKRVGGASVQATWTGPATTACAGDYYLDSNGNLYNQNVRAATSVGSAAGWNINSDQYAGVSYNAPVSLRIGGANIQPPWAPVPSGSTPIGGDYFLAPNGDVYSQNTKVTSNVSSAIGWTIDGNQYATVVSNGVAKRLGGAAVVASWTGPATTALAADYYLDSNGNLYWQNTKVTSNITSAQGWNVSGTQYASASALRPC